MSSPIHADSEGSSPALAPLYNSQLQELLGLELLYHPRRLQAGAPVYYPSRRRQLLFSKYSGQPAEGDSTISSQYVLLRQKLLVRKHGPPPSLFVPHRSSGSILEGRLTSPGTTLPVQPEEPSEVADDAMEGSLALQPRIRSAKEIYSFSGMAAFFDQHKQAVTSVQFANNNANLFACASMDGRLSICSVTPQQVVHTLQGHSKGVTDLEWSAANDFILSVSLDSSVRLWDTKTGDCVRTIVENSEVLTCAFCPVNNNYFAVGVWWSWRKVGTRKGDICVYNLSTGKPVAKPTALHAPIKALRFDPHGLHVFAGDEAGAVHVLEFSSINGRVRKLSRTTVAADRAVTSLAYGEWLASGVRQRPEALLMVNTRDNYVRIYSVQSTRGGGLKLRNSFLINHQSGDIRSAFCPLMSLRPSPCVVTGTEESVINILDLNARTIVNQLKGHSAPIAGVSWAFDESVLATSDEMGVVIIWRREVDDE